MITPQIFCRLKFHFPIPAFPNAHMSHIPLPSFLSRILYGHICKYSPIIISFWVILGYFRIFSYSSYPPRILNSEWPHGRVAATLIFRWNLNLIQTWLLDFEKCCLFSHNTNSHLVIITPGHIIDYLPVMLDLKGDYRKIGDVILKNLNQNTMEHYGR